MWLKFGMVRDLACLYGFYGFMVQWCSVVKFSGGTHSCTWSSSEHRLDLKWGIPLVKNMNFKSEKNTSNVQQLLGSYNSDYNQTVMTSRILDFQIVNMCLSSMPLLFYYLAPCKMTPMSCHDACSSFLGTREKLSVWSESALFRPRADALFPFPFLSFLVTLSDHTSSCSLVPKIELHASWRHDGIHSRGAK